MEMQTCNVLSNNDEDTVGSSQHSELTLKLQSAESNFMAAATAAVVAT